HSVATILETAVGGEFEMQRLHGMGEALYEPVVGPDCRVRVYAPVGSHEDLLAYLVRRLLENGANTSFVHRLVDQTVPEEAIVADPISRLRAAGAERNPRIPLPRDLFPDRRNSAGIDLADRIETPALLRAVHTQASASRSVAGAGAVREVRSPADRRILVGTAGDSTPAEIDRGLARLAGSWRAWDAAGGAYRAATLERAADLIETAREEQVFLLAREGGKTLADGLAELREAADACRWYARQARADFSGPRELPGPTGERNTWQLGGRGVFAAIAPWNFPLAIFIGQVAAALAAGNAVAAKAAEQTPLIAARAVALLHEAGVPQETLALFAGNGEIGQALVSDPRIGGVAFTGSTETAKAIARALTSRPGPLIPLIAETGGINAMVVDSSALPEQVVTDVLMGAFGAAGQRCSALRLLCVQNEIADHVLRMLAGAAETLVIGDPLDPVTDIGPVIDEDARASLDRYCAQMGTTLFQIKLPPGTEHGSFFAPRAYLLSDPASLQTEVFGPVLHVVRYAADRLDMVLEAIEGNGYGLTLGVHSRIESAQRRIVERLRVGNAYVNRNQIGAVVGVQPFGGRGLSGTGPKAGSPVTLYRFAEEQVVSVNTAAAGGNAALLATDEA
ncbi:MAG: bifunctional proline dehydrogenase/L-glutamate gamma-semialdehyde dehydrogenase PutA, partial [Pseudomonadota bacterium]|nr:bifunctional proline dehydrogenase/L-glutamate gamma-semialdehyde dehydrogenase PutA [Pseudomonadota bacterium]